MLIPLMWGDLMSVVKSPGPLSLVSDVGSSLRNDKIVQLDSCAAVLATTLSMFTRLETQVFWYASSTGNIFRIYFFVVEGHKDAHSRQTWVDS